MDGWGRGGGGGWAEGYGRSRNRRQDRSRDRQKEELLKRNFSVKHKECNFFSDICLNQYFSFSLCGFLVSYSDISFDALNLHENF